jgi:hypothetical protein
MSGYRPFDRSRAITNEDLADRMDDLHACLHEARDEISRVRHDGRGTAQKVEVIGGKVLRLEGREEGREALYNALSRALGAGVELGQGRTKKTVGSMSFRSGLGWIAGAIATGALAGSEGYKIVWAALSAVHGALIGA